MNHLGWAADGIERAMAVGAVPLEVYRRPGFTGGRAVRRADLGGGGSGVPVEPTEPDPTPEDYACRKFVRARA